MIWGCFQLLAGFLVDEVDEVDDPTWVPLNQPFNFSPALQRPVRLGGHHPITPKVAQKFFHPARASRRTVPQATLKPGQLRIRNDGSLVPMYLSPLNTFKVPWDPRLDNLHLQRTNAPRRGGASFVAVAGEIPSICVCMRLELPSDQR